MYKPGDLLFVRPIVDETLHFYSAPRSLAEYALYPNDATNQLVLYLGQCPNNEFVNVLSSTRGSVWIQFGYVRLVAY